MRLEFKHLTEALVQTAPTTPFAVGGLQQQKGTTYVPPGTSQINTATPRITQSPVPGIPMPTAQQPVQPRQLPKSGLIDKSNLDVKALPQVEPTSITTPVVPPAAIPTASTPPEQTGEWKGPQPQGGKPPSPTPPPAPAPSKPSSKPKPKTTPSDKPNMYQKQIDMIRQRSEVEAARELYYTQRERARRAASGKIDESYKFNRGYLKSLLSEQGGGGGFGGGGKTPGADPKTEMEKAIKYVKDNLKLGPVGSLIGKGVKKGYEKGKGIIRDYVKPLAIEASPLLTPPKETMASLTGRLSGLGFTERGIKDRMDYYKRLLGGSKQDPNTWSGAWKDEAAKLMTAALYDPRALSKLQ